MDEEELTQEEAEWIVANRQLIRAPEEPTMGMVIGPLAGEDAVRFLDELFSGNVKFETGSE